jgi:hypothetical protein
MYGLAYKHLGYQDVNVQILRHDCKVSPAVSMDLFLNESDQFFVELSKVICTGILGEKIGEFTSKVDNLPIATTTLPEEIIKQKLLK